MSKAYEQYLDRLRVLIDEVEAQGPQIEAAAKLMATSIEEGGIVHVFGSGHSHMMAEEVFYRAGGLWAFNAMLDINLTSFGTLRAGMVERGPHQSYEPGRELYHHLATFERVFNRAARRLRTILQPGDQVSIAKHKFIINFAPGASAPPPREDDDPFALSLLEKAGLERRRDESRQQRRSSEHRSRRPDPHAPSDEAPTRWYTEEE